jgi:hypothetical protein
MATEQKYGRATVERGTIGGDEPVFIIRAKDALACPAISAYWQLCEVNHADAAHLDGVGAAYTAVADWQEAHPDLVKRPD